MLHLIDHFENFEEVNEDNGWRLIDYICRYSALKSFNISLIEEWIWNVKQIMDGDPFISFVNILLLK